MPILVKLRDAGAFAAADAAANLRPLYRPSRPGSDLGLSEGPAWYVADLPGDTAIPWDAAHDRVAARLGVDESTVLFAEPDLLQTSYRDTNETDGRSPFGIDGDCRPIPQDGNHDKAVGPAAPVGWHLGDTFTQLRLAQEQVSFTEPRTRIAHLDTGYYPDHITVPQHIIKALERSFVHDGRDPASAVDPDNQVFLMDNSGHGTGTIGILAGGRFIGPDGDFLGGAPEAEVLPIRIADRVALCGPVPSPKASTTPSPSIVT